MKATKLLCKTPTVLASSIPGNGIGQSEEEPRRWSRERWQTQTYYTLNFVSIWFIFPYWNILCAINLRPFISNNNNNNKGLLIMLWSHRFFPEKIILHFAILVYSFTSTFLSLLSTSVIFLFAEWIFKTNSNLWANYNHF